MMDNEKKELKGAEDSASVCNGLLSGDLRIANAVEQYKIIDRSEQIYRQHINDEIIELQKLITASYEKSIYRLIYEETDGDYKAFVEAVAHKLRNGRKVAADEHDRRLR